MIWVTKMNNTNWEAIKLCSKFYFERGKEKNMASLRIGTIPLVSARKINNGIKGFVSNPIKKLSGGNVITLNNDGDGGAGLAYFQPFHFGLDTHVTALHPKDSVSEDTLLFISVTISKQHSIFGHGRSISLARAKRLKTMVPVTIAHHPDYPYMEQYVKLVKEKLINRYKSFLQSQIALLEHTDIPKLTKKQWQPFEISELFIVNNTKSRKSLPTGALIAANPTPGLIPRIRVTTQNNGIGQYTKKLSDKGFRVWKNFISVSFLGSAFYHQYEASLDMKVHCLQLRDQLMNEYIGLFISKMIEHNSSGVSYGNQLSSTDLATKKILLPVDTIGKPDFKYMEQYVKNLILKKYQQYLVFLNNSEL